MFGMHWDGGPDCSATCTGPHHGDHLLGLTCQGCGGTAYACFQDSGGNGCAFVSSMGWNRPALPPVDATLCLDLGMPVSLPPLYVGRHRS